MAEVDNDVEQKTTNKDDLQVLKTELYRSVDLSNVSQELVDGLYHYRDHYFETHTVEDASKKQNDVLEEMNKTLKRLEEKEEFYKNNAQYLLLRGRCLNIAAKFSQAAEDSLSRAVKLEPGLVEGWNTLGEQYWKKGDLVAAKTCFTGALQQRKNKVSLRNLSMVLRQLPPEEKTEEQSKPVLKSVDLARQAVQLDVADGMSWYILGNAYISLFFTSGQNPQMSQQALSAYSQAEKIDKVSALNADLHFNRATLFQYEEMFSSALAGYSRAAALDPGWDEPLERERQLLDYLDHIMNLIENKGKVKARRLRNMLSSLSVSALGPCASPQFHSPTGRIGSLEPCCFNSLTHGCNIGVAALGKVVFSLATEGRMAFTFGMVDSEETCCVVMVYNIADGWGVLIGDTVVIPDPHIKRHSITHNDKSYDFRSIRVDSPLLLIVNGKRQAMQSQTAASVSYKPHTE
ncbi:tetratricopeptide repeat protein 5 isoform X1 [Electrophorus electricus]|uniref:tetratricopeptide repeat protein 5 isoform X1 n=1 Tax=Electrophorus electricus TaxID=8005 RepID=UPI0015D092B2|nr:tetratricopeptide repeat protein 5 isoform X1 [Electrophorus electricus]